MNICSLAPYFHDEAAAWELLETLRWPNGPVCPHCSEVGQATLLKPRDGQRTTAKGSVSYRRTWKCRPCRRKFSVLVGSLFEDSKVPVSKWLAAFYMLTANKNGVAAYEIHRTLGVSNKTAWFMMHRIREATKRGPLAEMLEGVVITDETYIGADPRKMNAKARSRLEAKHGPIQGGLGTHKVPVVTMIEKHSGEARSVVMPNVTIENLSQHFKENVNRSQSLLWTDSLPTYIQPGQTFVLHETVNHHKKQYVTKTGATTNHAEGYFSQVKRSLSGTHHHVSPEHLPRYLAEHDFRYSTRKLSDSDRMVRLMSQTGGRRLTYKALKADGPSSHQ